jgi:hypothetical protein
MGRVTGPLFSVPAYHSKDSGHNATVATKTGNRFVTLMTPNAWTVPGAETKHNGHRK